MIIWVIFIITIVILLLLYYKFNPSIYPFSNYMVESFNNSPWKLVTVIENGVTYNNPWDGTGAPNSVLIPGGLKTISKTDDGSDLELLFILYDKNLLDSGRWYITNTDLSIAFNGTYTRPGTVGKHAGRSNDKAVDYKYYEDGYRLPPNYSSNLIYEYIFKHPITRDITQSNGNITPKTLFSNLAHKDGLSQASSLDATFESAAILHNATAPSGAVFNGTHDYLHIGRATAQTLGTAIDITIGGPMTIAFWAKFEDNATWARLCDFSNGPNADNIIISRYIATSKIHFSIRHGASSKAIQVGNIVNNKWTHIVGSVSGSTMKLYQDGALIGSINNGWEPIPMVRNNMLIGKSAWDPDDKLFKGIIGSMHIWNTALSDNDINTIYNHGTHGETPYKSYDPGPLWHGRIQQANKRYRWSFMQNWKTDPGFMMYTGSQHADSPFGSLHSSANAISHFTHNKDWRPHHHGRLNTSWKYFKVFVKINQSEHSWQQFAQPDPNLGRSLIKLPEKGHATTRYERSPIAKLMSNIYNYMLVDGATDRKTLLNLVNTSSEDDDDNLNNVSLVNSYNDYEKVTCNGTVAHRDEPGWRGSNANDGRYASAHTFGIGREPICKIKINGSCDKFPNAPKNTWFNDNEHGGPTPTTYTSCAARRKSWSSATSCAHDNIDMSFSTYTSTPNSIDDWFNNIWFDGSNVLYDKKSPYKAAIYGHDNDLLYVPQCNKAKTNKPCASSGGTNMQKYHDFINLGPIFPTPNTVEKCAKACNAHGYCRSFRFGNYKWGNPNKGECHLTKHDTWCDNNGNYDYYQRVGASKFKQKTRPRIHDNPIAAIGRYKKITCDKKLGYDPKTGISEGSSVPIWLLQDTSGQYLDNNNNFPWYKTTVGKCAQYCENHEDCNSFRFGVGDATKDACVLDRVLGFCQPNAAWDHYILKDLSGGIPPSEYHNNDILLTNMITDNTNNITDLSQNVFSFSTNISNNTTDISNNTTDIMNNTTYIMNNTTDISNNIRDISNNIRDIINNTTNIINNTTDISNNTSNMSDISQNELEQLLSMWQNTDDVDMADVDMADVDMVDVDMNRLTWPYHNPWN